MCKFSGCTADTDSNQQEAILPDNLDPVKVDVKLTNPTSPLEGDLQVNVKAEMTTLTPVLGVVYGKTKELSYTVTIKTES